MSGNRSDTPRYPAAPGVESPPKSLIDTFEANQPELFSIAYRMLGSAPEAEDIVQEAYLRIQGTTTRTIQAPQAYLRTIVRRLCLDALMSAQAVHEQPLDPQSLAPPLIESGDLPLQYAVWRESVSSALRILLERLTPQERAVFLLHEVFVYSYQEIAALIDLSVANCRQLFHRAQQHLAVDHVRFNPAPAEHERIVERFLAAAQHGNLSVLAAQLVEEVECWSGSRGYERTPLQSTSMA